MTNILEKFEQDWNVMQNAFRQSKEIVGLSGREEQLAYNEAEAIARSEGNDQYEEMVDNALAFGETY